MEITKVKLSQLRFDKRNARMHSHENIEEVKRSLEKYGQYRPFVVQESTNRVLVGNCMLSAMKELGWQEGYAYIINIDDEQATKLALTDNRTSELSEWNTDILKDLIQEMGPEPDIPGWTEQEIENMFYIPENFDDPTNTKEGQTATCPECGYTFPINSVNMKNEK